MDAASSNEVDEEVIVVQLPLSGSETVAELFGMEDVSNSNDDTMETEDEPVYWPDKNKLLQIIETIQKFSLFSIDGAIVQSFTNHVAVITGQDFAEKNKQTTIRDIFSVFVKSPFKEKHLTAL